MFWYDHMLRPFVRCWVLHFPVPMRPLWLHRVMVNHLRRWHTAKISNHFLAAQAASVGIVTRFWPAGTDKETILRWYDEQVVHTPAIPQTGLDYFKMFLFRCTEAEAAHAKATGIPLPRDHVLAQWMGMRPAWRTHARHQFADALPADHQGLCTVANSAATTLEAVFGRTR